MERKSWKIGWQISRSKENLPAFKSLIVRELRRNWKIWRIFQLSKRGAAVSAAPTKLLNTFYLIGALLALASGKAERIQMHPLVGECYKLVGALLALASGKAERRQVHPLFVI